MIRLKDLTSDQVFLLLLVDGGAKAVAGNNRVRSIRALVRKGLVVGRETDVVVGRTVEGCSVHRRGHVDLELTSDGEAVVAMLLIA